MKEYLKQLRWPETWGDFADLLSKTVLALMSAVIAAGVWTYSHYEQSLADLKQQEEQKAQMREHEQQEHFDHNLRLLNAALSQNSDKRDNITLFLEVLPKDESDPSWAFKVRSLAAYCVEELNGVGVGHRAPLLTMLCDANSQRSVKIAERLKEEAGKEAQIATKSGDAAAYINTVAATAQVSALAAVEAANTTPSNSQWYAVLASLPIAHTEDAIALAKSLNAKIGSVVGACDIHIYETKIGNSYAITSGGPKSEPYARARVKLVKGAGIAVDAFAQPDAGWTLSVKATQPRWSFHTPCG